MVETVELNGEWYYSRYGLARAVEKELVLLSEVNYFVKTHPPEKYENNPDDTTRKQYQKRNNQQKSNPTKLDIKEYIGLYLSSREIIKATNISVKTLDKWRNQGVLEAVKLKRSWHYSISTLERPLCRIDSELFRKVSSYIINHPKVVYALDNKPASLLEIIENTPDDNTWKEYLEKNNLLRSDSAHRYITKKIGEDYLSARHIGKHLSTRTLDKWRGQGKLEAVQLKGNWYYSRKSLAHTMKTSKW